MPPTYSLLPTTTQASTGSPTYHAPSFAGGFRKTRTLRARLVLGIVTVVLGALLLSALWHWLAPTRLHLPAGLDPSRWHAWGPEREGVKAPLVEELPPVESEKLTRLEELVKMVEGSRGFYARDYSLWLGWNNVRFITETAIVHADLLNRTLILPTAVYARACEYAHEACAAFAHQVNRGDAVSSDEWRELPQADQQAWVMPWGRMMDLDLLRARGHRVVTTAEFLEMHGLDPKLEKGDGSFPSEALPLPAPNMSYPFLREPLDVYRIENGEYDPFSVVRTDVAFPEVPPVPEEEEAAVAFTKRALENWDVVLEAGRLVRWQEAMEYVRREAEREVTDEEVERWARWAGYERIHSFGNGGEMTKTVTESTSQLTLRSHARAFAAEFADRPERIVHLRGEIHLGRPPGGLRFTTPQARDECGRMVLWHVGVVEEVRELAEVVARRMDERVGGRMWSGAHMRRGDFARLGWAQESSIEAHVNRIKMHLDSGRQALEIIKRDGSATAPEAANCTLDTSLWQRDTPREGDPFYLATDERSASGLSTLHGENALLLSDLLTPEDRTSLVGWPLLFTDVLAEVEQEVLARGAFFYGSSISSVAGGVLNGRARAGRDTRTGVVD